MSSTVVNQPDLSTTYKSEATTTKTVSREAGKWEKGEARQRLNLLTNPMKEDGCLTTT